MFGPENVVEMNFDVEEKQDSVLKSAWLCTLKTVYNLKKTKIGFRRYLEIVFYSESTSNVCATLTCCPSPLIFQISNLKVKANETRGRL